jgi:hypothetical protein
MILMASPILLDKQRPDAREDAASPDGSLPSRDRISGTHDSRGGHRGSTAQPIAGGSVPFMKAGRWR